MAVNRLNVVVVTTIFVLHVDVIGHYVPCRHDVMFPRRSDHARLRARKIWEALPPWSGWPSPPSEQQFGLELGTPPIGKLV